MEHDMPFDMSPPKPISYHPRFYNQMGIPDHQMKKDISAFHLRSSVLNCHACSLHSYTKSIPMGNMDVSVMVIGQTPRDVQFDTPQGELLVKALRQCQFDLDDIYFTAALKCEEANNFSMCHHHLISELILVNPLMIIALGYYAGYPLLENVTAPGDTGVLPNGSDIIVTNQLNDITTQDLYSQFCYHLSLSKKQLDFRKQQRGVGYGERVYHVSSR